MEDHIASPSSSAAGGDVPTSDAVAAVEESLGTLFRRAQAAWRDAAAAVHPELQPIGYTILSTLVHTGSAQSGQLADSLAIDKSVLSRQTRILEELGLATTHVDPADGRARILRPTSLAEERIRDVKSTRHLRLQERLRGFTSEELRLFSELLDRLGSG